MSEERDKHSPLRQKQQDFNALLSTNAPQCRNFLGLEKQAAQSNCNSADTWSISHSILKLQTPSF